MINEMIFFKSFYNNNYYKQNYSHTMKSFEVNHYIGPEQWVMKSMNDIFILLLINVSGNSK